MSVSQVKSKLIDKINDEFLNFVNRSRINIFRNLDMMYQQVQDNELKLLSFYVVDEFKDFDNRFIVNFWFDDKRRYPSSDLKPRQFDFYMDLDRLTKFDSEERAVFLIDEFSKAIYSIVSDPSFETTSDIFQGFRMIASPDPTNLVEQIKQELFFVPRLKSV